MFSPSNFKPRSNPTWVNSYLKSGTVVALHTSMQSGIKQDAVPAVTASEAEEAALIPEVADAPIIHIRDLSSCPLLPSRKITFFQRKTLAACHILFFLHLSFDSD